MEMDNEFNNQMCIEKALVEIEINHQNSFNYFLSASLLSKMRYNNNFTSNETKGILYCSKIDLNININEYIDFDFDKSEDNLVNELNSGSQYLAESRKSFTPLGLMIISNKLNFDRNLLNKLLNFEVYVPNSVFIFYSTLDHKAHLYKLTLKAIQNYFLSKTLNIRPEEYMIDLYNNFYLSDFLKECKYNIKNDFVENFSSFATNNLLETDVKYVNNEISNDDLNFQYKL